jgi:hypothetical protein
MSEIDSVVDIDREEWRSARDEAMRDGSYEVHPLDCRCRQCLLDEYDPAEEYDR